METLWRPLRLAGWPSSCPPLFAKSQFAANSYVVLLTDLSNIWKETMDRKSIFKRSLLEETPIDPTEDAAQMQLLLKHIRSALDGEKGTRRQLIRDPKEVHALSLHLTTPLPGSLSDLQWTIRFKALSSASLRHHLIAPLMSKVHHQMQQIDDLISQLNAKDHVISKLLDKLEGTGMDITSVFPGAAGVRGSKRSTPREQAARQVQGLGIFDSQQWQKDHSTYQSTKVAGDKVLEELKGPVPPEHADDSEDANFQWLSTLPCSIDEVEHTITTSDAEGNIKMDEDTTAAADGDDDDDDDDDDDADDADDDVFERQETPPHLRKPRIQQNRLGAKSPIPMAQKAQNHEDEETTDEENLDDASSQPPRHVETSVDLPSSPPTFKMNALATSSKSKRLGKLGGGALKPPVEKTPVDDVILRGESTGSETEDENVVNTSDKPDSRARSNLVASEQAMKAPTGKRKLGVLGGRKGRSSPNGSASPPRAREPSPEPIAVSGRARSKIGGKGAHDAPLESTTEQAETSAAVSKESSGPPRQRTSSAVRDSALTAPGASAESEYERANRKREELKRQLEKSQSPKKKRKF